MMKKLLLALMVALLVPLGALAEETGYVRTDKVHLRSAATKQSASRGLYFGGTELTVLDDLGDWLYVRIGTETGYMMAEFVSDEAPPDDTFVYRLTESNGLFVNLREYPGMDAEVLTTCRIGQPVLVMGETSPGWSYVTANGKTGYILTDLLKDCPEASGNVLNTTPDGNIIMIVPSNLQCLYYVASEPLVRWIYDDVNFDGYADIVAHTAFGASNLCSEFFVYDAETERYTRVDHGLNSGIFNYRLYPEGGYVLSCGNNGNAGMLHQYDLFRWEDGEMRRIRSAVCEEKTEVDFTGDVLTTVMHLDTYTMTVRDFTQGERVLWSAEFVSGEDMNYDMLEQEEKALWQGL